MRESDILMHIVDISHPGFEEQIEVVNRTLNEIKAGDKPTIYVFNKIDAFTFIEKDEFDLSPATRDNISLDEFKNSYMAKENSPSIFISAKKGVNVDVLRKELIEMVRAGYKRRYPYSQHAQGYPGYNIVPEQTEDEDFE